MLFDTHTHLDDARFDADREETLARMREAGVELALCVGADLPSSRAAVALAESRENLYAAVGVHPHEATQLDGAALAQLLSLAQREKVKAMGEIGLDYHYDLSPRPVQREAFLRQLDAACQLGLPVILHIREAHGDALELLRGQSRLPQGVVHCYSGSWESAEEYLRLGFMISFTGSVTFKNAVKLQAVAQRTPADRLMVETDCPYLAPVPVRGRRNEPAYVLHVARFLAQLRGIELKELARQTTQNAKRLFGIA